MCIHGEYSHNCSPIQYMVCFGIADRDTLPTKQTTGPTDHASAGRGLVLKSEVHAEASAEKSSLLRVVCTVVTLRIVTYGLRSYLLDILLYREGIKAFFEGKLCRVLRERQLQNGKGIGDRGSCIGTIVRTTVCDFSPLRPRPCS